MAVPMLSTKLRHPVPRPGLVPRPRLLAQLETGLRSPLTLLTAPAGFGKTSLLTEYFTVGPGQGWPLAWLSLDADDNDVSRCLRYLVAALARLQPGLGQTAQSLLEAPSFPEPHTLLESLAGDLETLTQPAALILDDYHVIHNAAVHAGVAYLLEHLPPPLRVVCASRMDPPFPLARLRARGELTELRAADLRFSAAEAECLLRRALGPAWDQVDLSALIARTEGWVTGLQLATLSLHGHDPATAAPFIASFTGSHRYVADYLVEEVLSRLSGPLRTFLLMTAILERFTGSLCDAITGRADGQATLEQLEHANLFVIPLDNERLWYRYHHLFAELLQQQLLATRRSALPELHRRASHWWADQGEPEVAIRHALAAQDWPGAISLMEVASQPARRRGEIAKVKAWIDALPAAERIASPQLQLNYGWAMILAGRFDEGDQVLAEIEPLIPGHSPQQVDWLAARVWAARGRGDLERAVRLAHEALALPAAGEPQARCLLMTSLSLANWHLGRVAETGQTARQAADLADRIGNWHLRVLMQARVALVQAAQGQLRLAEQTYLQALRTLPEVPAWAGGGAAQHYLAAIYYEWNDLAQAQRYAEIGLAHSRLTGHTEFHINSYRQLAYIWQARGEASFALEAMERAAEVARERRLPHLLWGPLAATQAQLALAQNDLPRAAEWLARVQGGYGSAFHYLKLPLEPAKLALAHGERQRASALLAERYAEAEARALRYAQIEIRILQALAAHTASHALAYLAEALHWAEPEGFVRVFVDQGPTLAPLLRAAVQHGAAPDYAARLLTALTGTEIGLPGVLSARELEVLRLLAAGRSNQQIAAELVVATGTVKKHLNNIFGKLQVRSRTECAARARELHLA